MQLCGSAGGFTCSETTFSAEYCLDHQLLGNMGVINVQVLRARPCIC